MAHEVDKLMTDGSVLLKQIVQTPINPERHRFRSAATLQSSRNLY